MVMEMIETCLMDRPKTDNERSTLLWVNRWAVPLSNNADAVLDLVDALSEDESDCADDCLVLLSRILDEARMNIENDERGAADFFEGLTAGLAERADADELDAGTCFGISQAYLRAGLTPPDQLRSAPEAFMEVFAAGEPVELPDVGDLVNGLVPEGSTPFEIYTGLREMLGAIQTEVTTTILTHMIGQGNPRMVAIGRYFLLDPVAEMRDAAISGFELLADHAKLDAAVLSDLIRVRNWIPNGPALDKLIKTVLRREPAGGSVPQPWQLHRVMTSLPDGTGSQSIMGVCSRGNTRAVAAVMIKAGHGIKDAYVIPCASRNDQKMMVEQIERAMAMYDVSPSYLACAFGIALGDGLERGRVTAPGFLDVAPMFGVSDVTPQHGAHDAVLAAIDPLGELAALSDNRRSRLIGKSRNWFSEYDITSSWFMSDASLMTALEQARTEASAKKIVAGHLETKREFWAKLFARSALILSHDSSAASDAWLSFAAVAQALASGRETKKIPVFEDILEHTLYVAAERAVEELEAEGAWDDDETGPPAIAPEQKGELAKLLKGSRLKPDQIDGYLTAVLIAPEFMPPHAWLMPLMQGVEVKGQDSIQRILDIIMVRFGLLNEAVLLGEIGSNLRDLPTKQFQAWAEGFAHAVDAVKGAWPKRAQSRDDKQVIDMIRRAATEDLTATLRPLLPSWLQATASKWREEV